MFARAVGEALLLVIAALSWALGKIWRRWQQRVGREG